MSGREKARTARLSFSLLERGRYLLTPKKALNCDCRKGGISAPVRWERVVDKNGVEQVKKASDAVCIFPLWAKDSQGTPYQIIGYIGKSGTVYLQWGNDSFNPAEGGFKDGTSISFWSGTDVYTGIFGNGKSVFMNGNGQAQYLAIVETLPAACFHKHRLFVGMTPSSIAYSAPEKPTDFKESVNGGGKIHFPNVGGKLLAMKVFRGEMYLFFEYGILRLDVGGEPKDFKTEEVEYKGGKIIGKTVAVGNSGIYFVAVDGIYRFDGKSVERIYFEFAQLPAWESGLESAAAVNNQVYLRYQTGYTEMKTLIVREDGDGCYYAENLDLLSEKGEGIALFASKDGMLCYLSDRGQYGLDGEFLGAETDFGIAGRKRISKLRFYGEGSFSFTLKNGGRRFSRAVTMTDGVAEVSLSECGISFTFDFILSKGARIEGITAEIGRFV